MRVLIVDDHPLIAEGLVFSLKDLDPTLATVCAEDSGQALAALDERNAFNLILLDLSLPGVEGLELLERLRSRRPEVPVVVLSANDGAETVRAALDAGAMGFISKRSTTKVLVSALRLVLAGGIYVPPQVLSGLARQSVVPPAAGEAPPVADSPLAALGLTERQLEVLSLIVEGRPTKAICRDLAISEGTAKTHIAAVMRALRVTNRTQVLYALAHQGIKLPGLLRN